MKRIEQAYCKCDWSLVVRRLGLVVPTKTEAGVRFTSTMRRFLGGESEEGMLFPYQVFSLHGSMLA